MGCIFCFFFYFWHGYFIFSCDVKHTACRFILTHSNTYFPFFFFVMSKFIPKCSTGTLIHMKYDLFHFWMKHYLKRYFLCYILILISFINKSRNVTICPRYLVTYSIEIWFRKISPFLQFDVIFVFLEFIVKLASSLKYLSSVVVYSCL